MKSVAPGAAPLEADAGAAALAFALQMLGLPADPAEITHQSGKRMLDETDLLRAVRRFPVKARAHASRFERLAKTPLPVLAALKNGGWLVVGRVGDDRGTPIAVIARRHARGRSCPAPAEAANEVSGAIGRRLPKIALLQQVDGRGGRCGYGAPPAESCPWCPSTDRGSPERSARDARSPSQRRTGAPERIASPSLSFTGEVLPLYAADIDRALNQLWAPSTPRLRSRRSTGA